MGYKIWYSGTTNVQETKQVKIVEGCFYNKDETKGGGGTFKLNHIVENEEGEITTGAED